MNTPEQIISEWLDEKLTAVDPSTDEYAYIIWNMILEEHSCCDAMTFTIKGELGDKIAVAVYPALDPKERAKLDAIEDAENAAKGLV